jgi:hypothetical protein
MSMQDKSAPPIQADQPQLDNYASKSAEKVPEAGPYYKGGALPAVNVIKSIDVSSRIGYIPNT